MKFALNRLLYFFVISIPKYVIFSEVTLNEMFLSSPASPYLSSREKLNGLIVLSKVRIESGGLVMYIKMSSTYSDILLSIVTVNTICNHL